MCLLDPLPTAIGAQNGVGAWHKFESRGSSNGPLLRSPGITGSSMVAKCLMHWLVWDRNMAHIKDWLLVYTGVRCFPLKPMYSNSC